MTSNGQNLTLIWFGLLPVRSSLLRESLTISFPPVTKIFQFTGFWYFTLSYREQVSPFGNPRLQTIFGISSRLIAAKYVLLPPFYPRHPFFALKKIYYYMIKINLSFSNKRNILYYCVKYPQPTRVSLVKKKHRVQCCG